MSYNLSLNPKIRNRFDNKIDRNSAGDDPTRYEYIKEGAFETYRENYLRDTKIFKGIVLKSESQVESSRVPIGDNADAETGFIALRVRIPELHAHIPEPCAINEEGSPEDNRGIIEMHPLFVAPARADGTTPPPPVGSIVEVSFNKGPNGGIQSDGVYHRVYQSGPGATEGASDCQALVSRFTDEEYATMGSARGDGEDGYEPIGPGTERRQRELQAARQVATTPQALFPYTPFRRVHPVTSDFNVTRQLRRGRDLHRGIDFGKINADLPIAGTEVFSMTLGQVSLVDRNATTGAGNYVEILVVNPPEEPGLKVRYLHLEDDSIPSWVERGAEITEARRMIGKVGNTGASEGAHLHIDIRPANASATDDDSKINPRRYMPLNAFRPGEQTVLTAPEEGE